jgi:hypothetical protein
MLFRTIQRPLSYCRASEKIESATFYF